MPKDGSFFHGSMSCLRQNSNLRHTADHADALPTEPPRQPLKQLTEAAQLGTQLPGVRTALRLGVKQSPKCAGCITRPHQLCLGDQEYGLVCTSHTCNTDGWPQVYIVTQLGARFIFRATATYHATTVML